MMSLAFCTVIQTESGSAGNTFQIAVNPKVIGVEPKEKFWWRVRANCSSVCKAFQARSKQITLSHARKIHGRLAGVNQWISYIVVQPDF